MPAPTFDHLRRHAVSRTLFKPTTLLRAIAKLGFVQADPIRAPARAQDLILRHRVAGYRAGDLERRYPRLPVEEDFLVNYGYLPRETALLLHPRAARHAWDGETQAKAEAILAFVRERGHAHPRDVEARFAHGRTTNWFGGTSNAATQLLDGMQFRSLLRVARREGGTRVYAPLDVPPADESPAAQSARARRLFDLLLQVYAPLPLSSLRYLVYLLRRANTQLDTELRALLSEATRLVPTARVDGIDWLWPEGENPRSSRHAPADTVRLLAPFDPIVWDRDRFALLWGWTYRFEAYTPPAKRVLGYYALPMLWRDRVVGWANAKAQAGSVRLDTGFAVDLPAAERKAVQQALAGEREALASFLERG